VSHDTIRLAKLIYGVGGGVSILIPGAGTFAAAFAISYALVDYYDRGCGVIFRYLYVPAVLTGMYTQCYYLSSCTVFDFKILWNGMPNLMKSPVTPQTMVNCLK
jgi:hypothetical protein